MSALKSGGLTVAKPAPKPAPTPAPAWKPTPTTQYKQPAGPQKPGNTLGATTTYNSGGMQTPQPQSMDMSSVLQQQPQQPSIDFDSLINPALQELDSTMGMLQGQFGQTQSDIQARGATDTARTTQEFDTAQKGLDTRKTTETQQAETAADEARRQYSEIQQGIQSRYGGTTGTGAFAGEVAGAQTMKNIGNIRQTLAQSITAIDNKKEELREVGRIALEDIKNNTQEQINQAKQRLENSLADIRRQKGELQGRKAELASQAMQFYQQSVQQVNAANAKFMQDLYVRQVEAENKLALARERASNAVGSLQIMNYKTGDQSTPIGINTRTGATQQLQLPAGLPTGGQLYDVGGQPKKSELEVLLEQQGLTEDDLNAAAGY